MDVERIQEWNIQDDKTWWLSGAEATFYRNYFTSLTLYQVCVLPISEMPM
jgi:hypothetical protein